MVEPNATSPQNLLEHKSSDEVETVFHSLKE